MILIFSISEISLIPLWAFLYVFFWFSFGTNVSNVAEWPWLPAQWLDQWGARHLWAIGEKPYTPMISVAMFHYQSAWIAVSETIEENVVCEVKGSVTRPNKKVFGCSCWCFNPAWDNVAQQKNNHWIYIYTCVDSCLWVVLISISLLSYLFEATNQLLYMGLWISLFWSPPIHVVAQLPRDPFQMFEAFSVEACRTQSTSHMEFIWILMKYVYSQLHYT